MLNGMNLGTLWCAPYRADISSVIRPGVNQLEIRVASLWPNRMIGDAQLPEVGGARRNGLAAAWPEWLLNGEPIPNGRVAWAAYEPFRKDSPLVPSGLIGPVTIQSE